MSNIIKITIDGVEETGKISDGFHTFEELYEFRKVYNAALFNEWYRCGIYSVHKSKKHGDGEECFGGGWFIVMATTPDGQISNHYEMKDWELLFGTVIQVKMLLIDLKNSRTGQSGRFNFVP